MLKQKISDITDSCSNCEKNHTLIKKYEHLIHLYQKKQNKDSVNGSKISNCQTSYSSALPYAELGAHRFLTCLDSLVHKRCGPFFWLASKKSGKNFVILNLSNRIAKAALRRGFENLSKGASCHRSHEVMCGLLRRMERNRLCCGFQLVKKATGFSVVQQQIIDSLVDKNGAVQKTIDSLVTLKQSINKPFHSQKLLRRQNMELQITNNKLCLQNQFLRKCLDEATRRQQKQNQRKRESLEELAEELHEKNDQIIDLQTTLKMYQDKYDCANILDDDLDTLKKEVQTFERVRDRLENDLMKVKDRLESIKIQNQGLRKKVAEVESENQKMRKDIFDKDSRVKEAERGLQGLEKVMNIFNKKIKRLTVYEKQYQGHKTPFKEQILDATKSELILDFLANISDPQYSIHAQNLFDKQEIHFLLSHRDRYQAHTEIPEVKNASQISQIEIIRGQSDSLFMAFDQEQEETANTREKGIITMKVMEMEMQRNRNVGAIVQLKQKMMHVRVIILNLLKSLELQIPVKVETEGILHVIFDMFEYSQQQRDSVFVKKRKLFGFI